MSATLKAMVADLIGLGPTHAVLQRPAHRRAELQRIDAADDVGEVARQRLFQLGLHALALLQSLCDDHGLGEEVVGQLHVERQVEAHRASPDIGAPVVDVGVALQQRIEASRNVAGGVDRRVLRQLQVDQQFGPVGGREELLRHEAHGDHGEGAHAERDEKRDPAPAHRQLEEPAEGAQDRAGLVASARPWAS